MYRNKNIVFILLVVLVIVIGNTALGSEVLTIYSGRSQNLIEPVFTKFQEATGIKVNVRYGGTAELVATILEERQNSPVDIFFAQDAGGLGALASIGRLQEIHERLLIQVDEKFRSPSGLWLGISGRARVVAYNKNYVEEKDLPDSIHGFLDPKWYGRIGWAPGNASFQAFITALRILEGEEGAEAWLRGIIANRPRVYHNNTSTVDAVGRGEVHVGFVNHYYLFRFIAEQGESYPVRNLYTSNDAGAMVNIAGVGILDVARDRDLAYKFIEFLLSPEIQEYFVEQNSEYPLVKDMVIDNPMILPIEDIDVPDIDLSNLEDLEGTLELLFNVGAL